jgi:hypothetical protein
MTLTDTDKPTELYLDELEPDMKEEFDPKLYDDPYSDEEES